MLRGERGRAGAVERLMAVCQIQSSGSLLSLDGGRGTLRPVDVHIYSDLLRQQSDARMAACGWSLVRSAKEDAHAFNYSSRLVDEGMNDSVRSLACPASSQALRPHASLRRSYSS